MLYLPLRRHISGSPPYEADKSLSHHLSEREKESKERRRKRQDDNSVIMPIDQALYKTDSYDTAATIGMLLTYGQFALTITKVQRANTTDVFLLSSHLKRAVTQFFYPLHTVIFECSKHHRPVLSLHTKC